MTLIDEVDAEIKDAADALAVMKDKAEHAIHVMLCVTQERDTLRAEAEALRARVVKLEDVLRKDLAAALAQKGGT